MATFLNGWRKRLGLLTLLMALVFTAGWVRSFNWTDEMKFHQSHHSDYLVRSSPQGINFTIVGFLDDYGQVIIEECSFLFIPYLPVICLLILVSVYLLLTKPRKSNQKKIGESTANEGA